jgi:hypothetical protein
MPFEKNDKNKIIDFFMHRQSASSDQKDRKNKNVESETQETTFLRNSLQMVPKT